MEINIREASRKDIPLICQMQQLSFNDLLQKYHDYNTNPGAEDEAKIADKFNQIQTRYYLIILNKSTVCGAIRIVTEDVYYRISPIFILPEYQNKCIAQKVFQIIEKKFTAKDTWMLSTIKEETKNCYLYEKIGYIRTGKEEIIRNGMTLVYYKKKCPTTSST